MNLDLKGKTAFVTGGSKGLGKSIAQILIEEGVSVTVASRSKPNYKVRHIECNLLDYKPLMEYDILINNVGGDLNLSSPICNIEEWERLYKFNLEIPIALINDAIPYMKEKKWGRIINISSLSATGSGKSSDAYASIKSALNMYTVKLAKELYKDGIVVSGIMPSGFIYDGNQWDKFREQMPTLYNEYLETLPTGRLAKPEEIANLVAFLCSDKAYYLGGSIIKVSGGKL
jgi:3-oxoacyl-[acyl-carrier protein] reductase